MYDAQLEAIHDIYAFSLPYVAWFSYVCTKLIQVVIMTDHRVNIGCILSEIIRNYGTHVQGVSLA